MGELSFKNKVKILFNKHKKRYKVVSLILFVICLFFIVFSFMVNPVIMDTVEIKSKALATRAMNDSIADVVMNSIVYDDLVNIL